MTDKTQSEHVLVPRVPTEAMLHAAFGTADEDNAWKWEVMLANAPTPPDIVAAAREYLEAADAFVDTKVPGSADWFSAALVMKAKRASLEQALAELESAG